MQVDSSTLAFAIVLSISLFAATVALGLRLFVKIKLTRTIGAADYILTAAHIVNVGGAALWLAFRIVATHYTVDTDEYRQVLTIPLLIVVLTFFTSALLTKISIGMWFIRIARRPLQRIVIFTPLAGFCLANILTAFLIILRCGTPPSIYRIVNGGDCKAVPNMVQGMGYTYACMNTICDIAFAAVPMHIVIAAKGMSVRQKVVSSTLIVVAVFGTVLSILRIPWLAQTGFGPTVHSSPSTARAIFLSFLETAVGILTISVATLRSLAKYLREWREGWEARRMAARASSPATMGGGNQSIPSPDASATVVSGKGGKGSGTTMISVTVVKSTFSGRLGVLPDVSLAESDGEVDADEGRLTSDADERRLTVEAVQWMETTSRSYSFAPSYRAESIAEVLDGASRTV